MTGNSSLELLTQTDFEHRAPDNFPVTCPSLDLTASWDEDGRNLLIWRPSSQAALKIHQVGKVREKSPQALAVTWRPDGQFLAVGWSDGVVRLMGLENNKAAHAITITQPSQAFITHIGWASSRRVNVTAKRTLSGALKHRLTAGDKDAADGLPLDLLQELTFLEIEASLPKVSPLPTSTASGGDDSSVFTLRSGTEFLFRSPNQREFDHISAMLVGTSDGRLQLMVHDSFLIGSFDCPKLKKGDVANLVRYSSHVDVSTQALLLASPSKSKDAVHLVSMDLPFLTSSPFNLPLLLFKLTTLQKLLRYLKQTQLHLQSEWRNTRELPNRFIRSLKEDLGTMKNGPRDIVSALYHVVLTGHAHKLVKEWMIDTVAERGHKRWDKAVSSGLEGLRSLIHENLLPALERCMIILSRMRGLARFHDEEDGIGYSPSQVTRIMDMVSCLMLTGHKILVTTMDELDAFTAFSTWLRQQIDRFATSTAAAELTKKSATLDYSKILNYIRNYLISSPLSTYFDEIHPEDCARDQVLLESVPNILDVMTQQFERQDNGKPSMKALSHVEFLVDCFSTWTTGVFDGVAQTHHQKVTFGTAIRFALGQPIALMEIRIYRAGTKDGLVFVAVVPEASPSQVYLFRIGIAIENGISAHGSIMVSHLDFEEQNAVDLKFSGDGQLVVLCENSDRASVIRIIALKSEVLQFFDCDGTLPKELAPCSTASFASYSVPNGQVLRPERLEVLDPSDVRGNIPMRIALLGKDRITLQSFSILNRG